MLDRALPTAVIKAVINGIATAIHCGGRPHRPHSVIHHILQGALSLLAFKAKVRISLVKTPLDFSSSYENKQLLRTTNFRSMVDGNRSEAKIQGSMRFISSFNLLTTWIRMERKRLAETAEQGVQNTTYHNHF